MENLTANAHLHTLDPTVNMVSVSEEISRNGSNSDMFPISFSLDLCNEVDCTTVDSSAICSVVDGNPTCSCSSSQYTGSLCEIGKRITKSKNSKFYNENYMQ